MLIILQVIFVLVLIIIVILFVFSRRRDEAANILPAEYKEILFEYVRFYRELDEADREKFEKRTEHFLSAIKITGVNAVAEDLDLVLIAAGAIIPVFNYPDWQYINLHEVLLYPGSFNHDFDQAGAGRSISGMVGTGPLQDVMIINKWQLRQGFINQHDAHNTAIHEFVHLIDKMDGTLDGVPEIILERKYVTAWKNIMDSTIWQMKNFGSDIDMYGATNPVEFFAVVSEYFFEKPDTLKANHVELYAMLERIYKREKIL